jgi:adenylate kinase family enzyme
MPTARRILIAGNCGAGKSWLREHLARIVRSPGIELDSLHWEKPGCKRDETEARRLVSEAARGGAWVMEGVYGWLAEVAAPSADLLIWLDLPWDACRAGLRERGIEPDGDDADLWRWAQAYWSRTTSSSFSGHERIFDDFAREKRRLGSRPEIAFLLAQWKTNIPAGRS